MYPLSPPFKPKLSPQFIITPACAGTGILRVQPSAEGADPSRSGRSRNFTKASDLLDSCIERASGQPLETQKVLQRASLSLEAPKTVAPTALAVASVEKRPSARTSRLGKTTSKKPVPPVERPRRRKPRRRWLACFS